MIDGFVDLQVNGFNGVNFSDPHLGIEDVFAVSSQLQQFGVQAYCPTLITSPVEVYRRNLPLLAKAMREQTIGAQIAGIHLEGPFINPEWGARGVHSMNDVLSPSPELLEKFVEWSDNCIALLTLAPERPNALSVIELAVNYKIVVSIGHHLANSRQIEDAASAGALAATHLGNGIPETIHRHDNPLWPVLADDRYHVMIITDGFHLPWYFVELVLKAKPKDKVIVTSDLMHFGGQPPGRYKLGETAVRLEANGKLHRENSEQLAGAARTIQECADYLKTEHHLGDETLRQITHTNPLSLISRSDV